MVAGFDSQREKRIAEEAADWRSRMEEPASEAEVRAFEAWLSADPAHPDAYAETGTMSALAGRLPRRLLTRPEPVSGPVWFRPAFAFTAAVALILAGGLWLTSQPPQGANAMVSNPGPAVRGVTLSDGTTVILDAGTELTVELKHDTRAVTLNSGRVRFDVARDAERPFSVTAAQTTVTARGTIFDVALVRGDPHIWVIEGKVILAIAGPGQREGKAIALSSGQAASVRDGRPNQTGIAPEAARWPAARLAFDNVPLATVAALANRRGSPKIEVSEAAIGALRVTGVLDIRDTRSLARKLAVTHDLRIDERAAEILLTR